jgi:hypothetical protein
VRSDYTITITMTEIRSSLFLARGIKRRNVDEASCSLGSLYGVGDVLAGFQANATKLTVIRRTACAIPRPGRLSASDPVFCEVFE